LAQPDTVASALELRFSEFSRLAGTNGPGEFIGSGVHGAFKFKDCQFYGSQFTFAVRTNSSALLDLNNCAFDETSVELASGMNAALNISVHDCLFRGGALSLNGSIYSTNFFGFTNNLFDWTAISQTGATNLHASYNAYSTNAPRLSPDSNDQILDEVSYATGPLGHFYHGNADLVDAGSTNADTLGLYHYTSQATQLKERNSIVDIGFHYVAVDANGNPIDTNGDGIPDYLQDSNGNGITDGGEDQWWLPLSIVSQPASQAALVGASVTFTVGISGTPPFGYQWRFNGTNLPLETSASLTLATVQLANSGNYSVEVTSPFGSATSADAVLAVVSAAYDAAQGFSTDSNPNGVWSYGFSDTLGGLMALDPELAYDDSGINIWRTNIWLGAPCVFYNPSEDTVVLGSITMEPFALGFHPGPDGQFSIIRFTAPATGQYLFWAVFSGVDTEGTTTDVHVLTNGVSMFDGGVNGFGTGSGPSASGDMVLVEGDTLDFVVGEGQDGGFYFDATGISVQIAVAPQAPSITLQPISQTVTQGCNLSFTVAATGTSPLGYRWRLNGTNIAGATSPSLSFTNVQATQAGSYSVVITNLAGSANSSNSILTVLVPPSILVQPISQTVTQGVNVTFSVTALGSSPLGYQWRFDSTNIAGARNASLTLTNVQQAQAGSYTVVITNAVGSTISSNSVLAVLVPPSLTVQPISQTVTQGCNVSFTVVATGSSPLTYQWWFNGTNLAAATGTLVMLTNVQPTQAGSYSVVISNLAGWAGSSNAVLAVIVPPTITNQPASQVVCIGDSVGFTVEAAGTAPFAYQWLKNGTNVYGATNSAYTVNNVSLDEAGTYRVTVHNPAGTSISEEATLAANLRPSALVSGSATITNGSSAAIQAALTGTAPWIITWSDGTRLTGVTNNPVTYVVAPTNTTTYTIANLSDAHCVATSTDLSGGAAIIVLFPPVIAVQPFSQSVCFGGAVVFSVSVTGSAPLTYQWLKSGTNVAGATDSSFTMANVSSLDSGSYNVFITNQAGSISSTNALLAVYRQGPPIVSLVPDTDAYQLSVALDSTQATVFVSAVDGTSHDNTHPATYSIYDSYADALLARVANCSDSMTAGINVTKMPIPTITPSSGYFNYPSNVMITLPNENLSTLVGGLYRTELSRVATSEELSNAVAYAQGLRNLGHSDEQIRADLINNHRNSQEYVTTYGTPGEPYLANTNCVIEYTTNSGSAWLPYTTPLVASSSFNLQARVKKVAIADDRAHYAWLTSEPTATASFTYISASWLSQYFGTNYQSNTNAAPNADPDHDGLTNLQEYQLGASPLNVDTDGDGRSDWQELMEGTDPLNPVSVAVWPVLASSLLSSQGTLTQPLDVSTPDIDTELRNGTRYMHIIHGVDPWYDVYGSSDVSGPYSWFGRMFTGTEYTLINPSYSTYWYTIRLNKDRIVLPSAQPLLFMIGSGPKVIDPQAWVDPEDADMPAHKTSFNGTHLTVAFVETQPEVPANQPGDQLGIQQGIGSNPISISSDDRVLCGTTQIGTLTPRVNLDDPIIVTFNSQATPDRVGILLKNLTFQNSSTPPSLIPRRLSFLIHANTGSWQSPINLKDIAVNAILLQPQSQTVAQGEDAVFSVFASGYGLTYQWNKGGAPIQGATRSMLVVPNALPADASVYTVTVTSTAGTAPSSGATLAVCAIANQPGDVSVTAGQTALFSVQANADSYQWRLNGQPVAGATSSSYTTTALSTSDSGKIYDALISCGHSTLVSRQALLTVQPSAPVIISPPVSQSPNEGADINFRVVALGAGTLTYQWNKGGSAIVPGTKYSGIATDTLTVLNASAGDNGSYTVTIANAVGTVTSSAASLAVVSIANACEAPPGLYPIGMSTNLLASLSGGNPIDLNGNDNATPGSFVWLAWDPAHQNAGDLETSLTIPGNCGSTYVNPGTSQQEILQIGKMVSGNSGISVSGVEAKLLALKALDAIYLPVIDKWNELTGSNARYEVTNYAKVKLVSYNLRGGNKRLTIQYQGVARCDNEPGVSFSTASLSYREDDFAKVIDGGANTWLGVNSPGANPLGGLHLMISFLTGGQSTDQLGVQNQGQGQGQISVNGHTVSYGSIVIGTINSANDGTSGKALEIVLGSNCTIEALRALMQHITYYSASEDPTPYRLVGAVLTDLYGPLSAPATIAINDTPVNDPPTLSAIGTLNGAVEDTPFTIPYSSLSWAASDVDSSPVYLRVDEVISGTLTKNGIPVISGTTTLGPGEQWVWIPAPDDNSPSLKAFMVRAYDGSLASLNWVQVNIKVEEVNDPPIAVNDSLTTRKNVPISVADTLLMSNDSPGPANEYDQILTLIAVSSQSAHGGSISLSGRIVTYTPPIAYTGEDTFTYTIQDNGTTRGAHDYKSSQGTVTVEITGAPGQQRPTLTSVSPFTGTEDAELPITYVNLLSHAVNATGSPLYFRVEGVSSGILRKNGVPVIPGTTLLAPGETWIWTPPPDVYGSGVHAFAIRAYDGTLASLNPVQVPVDLASDNDPPILSVHGLALNMAPIGSFPGAQPLWTVLSEDGNKTYLAEGSTGLRIINSSVPASPAQLAVLSTIRADRSLLSRDGTKLFVADSSTGLQVVDVSNPNAPTLITGAAIGASGVRGLALSRDGTRLFLAHSASVSPPGGVRIINVITPQSPAVITTIGTASDGLDVAVSRDGTRLFVLEGTGLQVYDVSSIGSPTSLGNLPYQNFACLALSPDQNVVYIGGSQGLRVVDVSDPQHLTELGGLASGPTGAPIQANSICVSADGTKLCMAGGSTGLHVFDVRMPSMPVLRGTFSSSYPVVCAALSPDESLAYLAKQAGGLAVIDVGTYNLRMPENAAGVIVPLTVYDIDTAASGLTLTSGSSDPTLASLHFNGSGSDRTLTVTPGLDKSGTATLTLSLTDGITTTHKTVILTVQGFDICGEPTISGLTITPSSTQGGGAAGIATGTVTLSGSAVNGGQVIAIASSSAKATVPPSVFIAGGETTADFPIQTAYVPATETSTITASYHGASQQAQLEITPPVGSGDIPPAPSQGFTASLFAKGFTPILPSGAGPLGIVRNNRGQMLTTDVNGALYIFPSCADGQNTTDATTLFPTIPGDVQEASFFGLTRSQNQIYACFQRGSIYSAGVVRLLDDGTAAEIVVELQRGSFNTTWSLAANPVNGHLFVTFFSADPDSIYEIDPETKTASLFGQDFQEPDGIAVSPDGRTLYVAETISGTSGAVNGYDIATKALVFHCEIPSPDGIAAGNGNLKGKLFVNDSTSDGKLWEVDLESGSAQTISQMNSRGDFVFADSDGTLLADYSDRIIRFTPPPGGSFSRMSNTIFTRDDNTQTYSPMQMVNLQPEVVGDRAVFNLIGTSGDIISARFTRVGHMSATAQSEFDLEYGVKSYQPYSQSDEVVSYAPPRLWPNYDSAETYSTSWNLSQPMLANLGDHVGNIFQVKLSDRITGTCQPFQVNDYPQAEWPLSRNSLCFEVQDYRDPQIPQGSCRDIVGVGLEAPLNGLWDVVFEDSIIASSGNPQGWDIEEDHNSYHGILVSVPRTASVGLAYKVRLAGSPARAAYFDVVPAESLPSVPILLPVNLSPNPVTPGNSSTATVTLDSPAPAGGATIILTSDTPFVVPASVSVPSGQSSAKFQVNIAPWIVPGNITLTASYNGLRQVTLRVVSGGGGSIPQAPVMTASPGEGRISLAWAAVPNALSYNIKRSRLHGGPYVGIFSGLAVPSFIDTAVVNGQTYYYVVSAGNDAGEGPNSAEQSATPFAGQVAMPAATPAGGSFTAVQTVSLSDATPGSFIHFTLDGSEPTEGSPVYKTPFQIAVTTPLRARAFKAGHLPSDILTSFFEVNISLSYDSVSCGDTPAGTLGGVTPDFSSHRGQAFFAKYYKLSWGGGAAGNVTISASSAIISPYLYLFASTALTPLAQTADSSQASHSTKLQYQVPAGSQDFYIEITSLYPGQSGDFDLYLDCGGSAPQIAVISGGTPVNNGDSVDFGDLTFGLPPYQEVYIWNDITYTGGSPVAGLDIDQLLVSGDIALSTHSVPRIPPGGYAHLLVYLTSMSPNSTKSGKLTIVNSDSSQSPFVVNFTATMGTPTVPTITIETRDSSGPTTTFDYNTDVIIVPTVNLANSIVTMVEFFATPTGGSRTRVGQTTDPSNLTMIWTKVPVGTYTLTARVTDNQGNVSADAAPVSIIVGAPNTLGSPTISPNGGSGFAGSVQVTMTPASSDANANPTIVFTTEAGSSAHWFVYPQQPITITWADTDQGAVTLRAREIKIGFSPGPTVTSQVFLIDPPTANLPPTAQIASPVDGSSVTGPVTVSGTALLDPQDASGSGTWRLDYRLAGDTGPWTSLSTGVTSVDFMGFATFDPTALFNGLYNLRLWVQNADGDASIDTVSVRVEGRQKLGNFTLSFTDMTAPVAGIPVQVTRTYDSRDKGQGDFGIGWRLSLNNVRIQKNGTLGSDWSQVQVGHGFASGFELMPLRPHTVTITFPNDEVYSFEATVYPASQSFYPIEFGTVTFVPSATTKGTLRAVADNDVLIPESQGSLDLEDSGGGTYDADEFELTTRDGRVFRLNLGEGLKQVTDMNGNVISFYDQHGDRNGIYKSTTANPSVLTPIVAYGRDGQNRITTITDPKGKSVNYTYGGQDSLDLVTVTDRATKNMTFSYDTQHNLIDIVDPQNHHAVKNTYDDNGRLLESIDALNNVTSYDYQNVGDRIVKVTDPFGHRTDMKYSDQGSVIEKTLLAESGEPITTKFEYSDPANPDKPTKVTDPLNRITFRTYSEHGDLLSETDNAVHTTTYAYNGFGQVTSVTDPNGITTVRNDYDERGNLISSTDALGIQTVQNTYNLDGTLATTSDAFNHTSHYYYGDTAQDPGGTGQMTSMTDAAGNQTLFFYDSNGNRTHVIKTRTLPDNSTETIDTEYEYDDENRVTKTTVTAQSPGHSDQFDTHNYYNDLGKLDHSVDPNGQTTTYFYDERGQLIETRTPDQLSTHTGYDALGRQLTTTDKGGKVTRFTYDGLGRLVTTLRPDGSTTTSTYDDAGQLQTSTEANGHTTHYIYDEIGRQVQIIDALGHITSFEYDSAGRRVAVTDANKNKTLYQYDDDGRLVQTTFADNTTAAVAYDLLGQKVSETDQAQVVTSYSYDELGRPTDVTKAVGTADVATTHYAYDELGNLTSQTDANQHETKFEYDYRGRRTARTLPGTPPGGQSEQTHYILISNPDPQVGGNVLKIEQTDFDNHTTTIQHDVMGRVLTKLPDSNLPTEAKHSVVFTYDPATGQRATMQDASGTATYTYDLMGRLTTKSHTAVGDLNYTYDAVGNVLTTKSKHGIADGPTQIRYFWDELNRLIRVEDGDGRSTTYSYDKVGNLQDFTYPTSTPVKTAYVYNELNRLTSMTSAADSSPRAMFDYNSDVPLGPAGNRLSAVETINAATTISRTVHYSYDNLYRLAKEDIVTGTPSGTIDYGPSTGYSGYDKVGNRQSRKVSSALQATGITDFGSQGFDARDRLTASTYDANGNTSVESLPAVPALPAQAISPTSSTPDEYDFDNHLIKRSDGTKTIEIIYDGDGNRVKKIISGSDSETRYYLVDDRNPSGYAQVLEEMAWDGTSLEVTRVYTYGHSLISESLKDGTWNTSFYGYDGHGNVRFLLDEGGNITDTYTYDAFGVLLDRTGSTVNNYLYCGEQFDFDLGTYYLRARYLNPNTGRFWTMDSAEGNSEDPLTLHKYLYCRGDPVNWADPSGFTWQTDFGRAVEQVIRRDFWGKDNAHRFANEIALSTLLGQPYTGVYRQRLDLAHLEPGNNYFFEIKHFTPIEVVKGYNKLSNYGTILGAQWRRGTMSDYTYGPAGSFPLIKTDIQGATLPGGYYALVLPPVRGLVTYVRVKPLTPRAILNTVLAIGVATARLGEEVAVPAAELAAASRTAAGLIEATEGAAEIGAVLEAGIDAELLAGALEAINGFP
jgi:RHS repeat-associated protein